MKAPLYSKEGKKKGEVVLNPSIFGARINERLLQLVQKAYAGNLRRGTASTKTRKDCRGGGRKPWKQKGTGRARAGSNRSPIWRGGGVVFGPHPRDYSTHISKKAKAQAIVSALSLKAKEKNLMLLEEANVAEPKTREWVDILKALPLSQKRATCIVSDLNDNLKRASSNASNWVKLKSVDQFNAYHLLKREKVLIEKKALEEIEKRLAGIVEQKETEVVAS